MNSEKAIGIKLLSDADLGRSPRSNQTHIGLSIKTLTFLRNGEIVDDVILVYKNKSYSLCCNFDLIVRENGRIDAPKIRKGFFGDSVVDIIRDKCSNDPGYDWYLIWFGLRNNKLVFWLIREDSEDFTRMRPFLSSTMKVFDSTNSDLKPLTIEIEKKLSNFPIWDNIIK